MKSMILLLLLSLCIFTSGYSFDKVVIWGHKLHSHTHSYIHEAFYRAFQELGYQTYWFDDQDNIEHVDFSNSLFLTEGQVDKNIPIRDDCLYVLHNCNRTRYQRQYDNGRCIILDKYLDDILSIPGLTLIEPCVYCDKANKALYIPWATDLLPREIDEMKKQVPGIKKKNYVYWAGTIGGQEYGNIDQLLPFIKACKENNIRFIHNDPWANGLDRKEYIDFLRTSYISPAIVGRWQKEKGYIPCRIFKAISYGQMGVTNSYRVYELFEKKIVYNSNEYELFYDAKKRMETWTLEDQYELMDFVKAKHTYLNRIQVILDFFTLVALP